jgi:hypothetical protein
MFLSLLLLAAIWLAKKTQSHSPAISRWFDVQLIATVTIEVCNLLLGWQSRLYTVIYDIFTIAAFIASAGVVWEAWKMSQSHQKA